MSKSDLARIVSAIGMAALAFLWQARRGETRAGGSRLNAVVSALAAGNIVWLGVLLLHHVRAPFYLDIMEGAVLQHIDRAMRGLPVYPEPSATYTSFSYNPLFYYLVMPIALWTNLSVPAVRLVAILGYLGSGAVVFHTLRRHTASSRTAFVGLGVFSAAYGAMDASLDTVHCDSWLLFTILLGTHLLDRSERGFGLSAGVLVLVASFWFKQHGALFLIGGLLYVTWRHGWRTGLGEGLLAALIGPLPYLWNPGGFFGPRCHYFTWYVPSGWMELSAGTFARLLEFVGTTYPFLAAGAAASMAGLAVVGRVSRDAWHWQFPFALSSAVMGAMDTGSSDNVFIPMGAWFIVLGMRASHSHSNSRPGVVRWWAAALAASFGLLLYDPRTQLVDPDARAAYRDLQGVLRALPGPVYAPSIAWLPDGPRLYPAVHWVAADDIQRGKRRTEADRALVAQILEPALHPAGPAFLLTNRPLTPSSFGIGELAPFYELAHDFDGRFRALRSPPRKFDHRFPRYLYRYRRLVDHENLSPLHDETP